MLLKKLIAVLLLILTKAGYPAFFCTLYFSLVLG
jgi:hypothetical protein